MFSIIDWTFTLLCDIVCVTKKQGDNEMILQAINSNIKDDSKPSQIGDESSFDVMEGYDEGNN